MKQKNAQHKNERAGEKLPSKVNANKWEKLKESKIKKNLSK